MSYELCAMHYMADLLQGPTPETAETETATSRSAGADLQQDRRSQDLTPKPRLLEDAWSMTYARRLSPTRYSFTLPPLGTECNSDACSRLSLSSLTPAFPFLCPPLPLRLASPLPLLFPPLPLVLFFSPCGAW